MARARLSDYGLHVVGQIIRHTGSGRLHRVHAAQSLQMKIEDFVKCVVAAETIHRVEAFHSLRVKSPFQPFPLRAPLRRHHLVHQAGQVCGVSRRFHLVAIAHHGLEIGPDRLAPLCLSMGTAAVVEKVKHARQTHDARQEEGQDLDTLPRNRVAPIVEFFRACMERQRKLLPRAGLGQPRQSRRRQEIPPEDKLQYRVDLATGQGALAHQQCVHRHRLEGGAVCGGNAPIRAIKTGGEALREYAGKVPR